MSEITIETVDHYGAPAYIIKRDGKTFYPSNDSHMRIEALQIWQPILEALPDGYDIDFIQGRSRSMGDGAKNRWKVRKGDWSRVVTDRDEIVPAAIAHSKLPPRAPKPAFVAEPAAPAAKKAAGYRTKHSPIFGEGRVYDSQPGATQYLGSDGTHSVQIWDES